MVVSVVVFFGGLCVCVLTCVSCGLFVCLFADTNFELGTRVPLLIRAPFLPQSGGHRTHFLAELVDIYPTIAELCGSGPLEDILDGVSLAPILADPTLVSLPTDNGTLNKTVAFQQYAHTTDYGCEFVFNNGTAAVCGRRPHAREQQVWAGTFMGFAQRDHRWRYVAWVPWDSATANAHWNSSNIVHELYDHAADRGTSFDAADVLNVAYTAAHHTLVGTLFRRVRHFFSVVVPPVHPPSPPST